MARTLLKRFRFDKGPSLFCSDDSLGNPPTSPLSDPLYPEIRRADYVDVESGTGPNGENVLTLHPAMGSGDWSFAGFWTGSYSFAPTTFELYLWYQATTASIDDMSNAPMLRLGTADSFTSDYLTLTGILSGSDVIVEIDTDQMSALQTASIPRSYLENRWVTYRIRGRVGAYLTSTTRRTDGVLEIAHQRDDQTSWTTLYALTNIDFGPYPFAIPFIKIGDAGLFGKFVGFDLYDGWGDDDPITAGTIDPCCATEGTAGGGTQGPDGTVTPVGPRQGTTGGIAPSYTACTGGGALPAATDPTDAQSLSGVTDPILHLKLEPPAGNQYWTQGAPINAGTTSSPIEARVLSYSPIPSEVLAGRDGVIPTPTFTVRVADTDRTIRGWTQSTTNRKILNTFGQVLAESYGQRQLDTEARRLAAGYLADWKFLDDLVAEFTFADVLGWRKGAMKRRVPQVVVSKDIFGPGVPEDSLGRPIPWVYGEFSDDYEYSLDNSRLPVGIVPCIPLGKVGTIPITNWLITGLGHEDWHAFLIGKVCKTFRAQYAWQGSINTDGSDTARGRIAVDSTFVTDYLLPSMSGWSTYFSGNGHVRVQAVDGTYHDLTMVFYRGPIAAYAMAGRFPPTFNVCGIEDVGDCTGNTITDGPTALAHFIAYGVFGAHTSGAWGNIPTLPNGAPVINRTSVVATKAIFDLRVTGGYQAAFIVGATGRDRRTADEEVTDLARGLDIDLGRNHHGQIVFSTVNDLASTSSLTAFDDSTIREGSFTCLPRLDLLENVKRFAYGPEPATGRNTGIERSIRDDASIDAWGEFGGEDVRVNVAVRREAVATDVARRELIRDSDPPYEGSFETDLRGTSLSVGQLITITTQWAHWPTTEAHVVRVTGIYPLTNENELLTRIEFEDVQRLLATPSNALAGMSGPAWGQPIGSSVGLTSQPIGSSVAGTARRLA